MAELARFVDVWPVVIIEAPPNSTYESIEFFCARYSELFKRRERFATIQDMTRMKGLLDAKSRKKLGDWTKESEEEIMRWHVASATIVESALIRGIVTAVHWFAKPTTPQMMTGSMREGMDYVVGHLRREGVPISEKLDTYQRALGGARAAAGR